jgi:hypothetical protein
MRYFLKAADTLKHLLADQDGVVSFEYIIVAACIVGAVAAAFGTGAGGSLATALTNNLSAVLTAFNTAIGG